MLMWPSVDQRFRNNTIIRKKKYKIKKKGANMYRCGCSFKLEILIICHILHMISVMRYEHVFKLEVEKNHLVRDPECHNKSMALNGWMCRKK